MCVYTHVYLYEFYTLLKVTPSKLCSCVIPNEGETASHSTQGKDTQEGKKSSGIHQKKKYKLYSFSSSPIFLFHHMEIPSNVPNFMIGILLYSSNRMSKQFMKYCHNNMPSISWRNLKKSHQLTLGFMSNLYLYLRSSKPHMEEKIMKTLWTIVLLHCTITMF